MNVKLTLKLDKSVIDNAKIYAKKHRTSLSKLVRTYFESLVGSDKHTRQEWSPLVEQLSGIVELPSDFDLKEEIARNLDQKYR